MDWNAMGSIAELAGAIAVVISLTSVMIAPIPPMASTASRVACWIPETWPAISSVALPVWLARFFTSLAHIMTAYSLTASGFSHSGITTAVFHFF